VGLFFGGPLGPSFELFQKIISYVSFMKKIITILLIAITLSTNAQTYTITIGAYTLDNSANYIATGNFLVFNSYDQCQIWSRTAGADAHFSFSHLHYNAADDVFFDNVTTTFSWKEYGPELDSAAISATCSAGVFGVNKTVNNISYYQDKPNLYLKIDTVVQNSSTIIEEHITKKELIKITDLLGRETIPTTNAPMFYIYEDGSVEKKIISN